MEKENLGKKIGYAVIAIIILAIIVISIIMSTNQPEQNEQNVQTENTTNVIDPEIIREETPDITMEAGA